MSGGSGTAFKFFPPTLTAARQVELFLLPCYRAWLGSFVRSFPCSHERRNRTLAAAITRPSVACCRQLTYPRFSVSHEKCEGRGGRARVYSLSCIQQPLFSTAAPRVFKRDSKEKKHSRRLETGRRKKLFRPRVSPSPFPRAADHYDTYYASAQFPHMLASSEVCLSRSFFSPGEIGGERRLIKQQQQQQCQRLLLPPTEPTNQRGGDPSSSVFFQSRWHHHCVYSLQSPRRTVPTPPGGGRQQKRGCSSGEARTDRLPKKCLERKRERGGGGKAECNASFPCLSRSLLLLPFGLE